MRITANVSDSLLGEAKQLTGAKTKTMVINLGLKELIYAEKIKKIQNLPKIPIKINFKISRKKR